MASNQSNGFFLFILGIIALKLGLDRYTLEQKVRNTPTSKVRSAAVGLVELVGNPGSDTEFTSPITKTKCVFWHLVCGYYRKRGKSAEWCTIYEKKSPPPLYLVDETGRLPVDIRGAEFAVAPRFQCRGPPDKLDPKVMAFLKENPDAGTIFNRYRSRTIIVSETYLTENDPLYVMGSAIPRKGAASPVAHENLIVSRGKDNVLYISDSGEKKVVDQLALGSVALIAGGILSSCIGILLIFI